MKQSLAIPPTTIRIPADLLRRADAVAERERRTRSAMIVRWIEDGLARAERKLPEVPPVGGALD